MSFQYQCTFIIMSKTVDESLIYRVQWNIWNRTLQIFFKKQKLSYFGRIKRHQILEKLILEEKMKGQRNRGRSKRYWEKDLEDWMGGGQVSGEWDEQQKIG